MKYRKILVMFLLFCEFITVFLSFKSFSNRDIKKVKEVNQVDRKKFSMFVETDTGYEEYLGSNFFPSGYQINLGKSKCVDTKGNTIEGILSGKGNSVTVTSKKTAYCYLYFDQDKSIYSKLVSDYSNNNGVSKTTSTSAETGNTYDVYYYTGNITNNNIIYGDYCWKMVISTENQGVKLLYNGVPTIADDGTKSCNNTGTASQLSSTKAFNSNYQSPAYVGYMYNSVYKVVSDTNTTSTRLTNSVTILNSQSSMTSSSRKYYFGDSVTYSNGTYTLNNATTYDSWSTDYASAVGKYTCRSTTSSSCSTVYYVAATTSSYMYYYNVTGGNEYNAYNMKLATSITDNGNGTYTLNSPVEVGKNEWYTNYSTYKNYYFCSDLTSTTCSDMYYSYNASTTSLSHMYVAKNFKYGNSFTYENGTYKLIDTNVSNIKQFWNWYTNYNTLSNNHYTCFNTTGECTSLYYINYTSNTNAYFATLTGGESVEDAISKMLDADDVNETDSTIKAYIDDWYADAILDKTDISGNLYSDYLENAIFCNNRTITGLGGWNPNGGSTTSYMYFDYNKLECDDKKDRFTLGVEYGGTAGYGNNALKYPIGLMSYYEANLARGGTNTNYLKSGQYYWLLSPFTFNYYYAYGYNVFSGGYLGNDIVSYTSGVRPAVSLNSSVQLKEGGGDGSATAPYEVELKE